MCDYLKHKERLRNRYHKDGLAGFNDYEVLEMMLSYSIIRKDTKPIAKALIKRFKNLSSVINAPIELLTEVDGIGHRTAVLIKLFKDVGDFYLKEDIIEKPFLVNLEALVKYLTHYYKGKTDEEFKVIYLNSVNLILYEESLSTGIVNQSTVYAKKLIEHVIHYKAASVVLAHNHPAGSIEPSAADIQLTKNIQHILKLIETTLFDHIIISGNKYLSMLKEGYLNL